jgi:hypothetical protein
MYELQRGVDGCCYSLSFLKALKQRSSPHTIPRQQMKEGGKVLLHIVEIVPNEGESVTPTPAWQLSLEDDELIPICYNGELRPEFESIPGSLFHYGLYGLLA